VILVYGAGRAAAVTPQVWSPPALVSASCGGGCTAAGAPLP